MADTIELEKTVLEIPVRRLEQLTKDVRKYEEYVNKCDISNTNTYANIVGSNIGYLRYTEIRTTEKQKQELKRLEEQFKDHMNRLKKCRCVKKIEK